MKFPFVLLVLSASLAFSISVSAETGAIIPVIAGVQKQSDGVLVTTSGETLQLQIWSDKIIRVIFAPTNKLPEKKSLSVIGKREKTEWNFKETQDSVILGTFSLRVQADKKSGAVSFFDLKGNLLLQEVPDGREFAPTTITNISGTSVCQKFILTPDEHIYGLGQHQSGAWNYRGTTVQLQQKNMEVAVPVLISSKGYGVLWDNPAITEVDCGKSDPNILSWTSEVGKVVDYYFMFGPTADDVVADYRTLTGAAPMMPEWEWGFFQCKERYASQNELTNIVLKYRTLGVPLDGIIQDWQYWPKRSWGSHQFDPERYGDPAQMLKDLHAMNSRVLISVWARFDEGARNYDELERAGALYETALPGFKWFDATETNKYYDAFNPKARKIYWRQMNDELFKLGIDGWWLDASEPELTIHWGQFRDFQTALGPAVDFFNAYPLMHTTSVYEGQRAATDKKRVVILTRSAYAGQQRNSAITWSGDIQGRWDVFAKQIPAGLNFSISGIPYWNTDIGGFIGKKTSDKNYQELFTRWFQFGAFNPMFRVHGTVAPKEIWRWDEPTQKILADYIRLRYRLIPYIYSTAWQVTSAGGTMLRPLMMDFMDEKNALDVGDQFLFGKEIMACPVTKSNATTRAVYLPGKNDWYDFWTGKKIFGGQKIDAASPIETMPLFVRAGSILPLGPVVQYVSEKPADPIELRVYRGADGKFTLYEDEDDNYNYEKGKHATIPISWDEKTQTLTFGKREGKFPGMLAERKFRVVFVGENHGIGGEMTEKADEEVIYKGDQRTVWPHK
jgi:alpha-D-xyloside xylohydrolase